jgi:hypothetical protein
MIGARESGRRGSNDASSHRATLVRVPTPTGNAHRWPKAHHVGASEAGLGSAGGGPGSPLMMPAQALIRPLSGLTRRGSAHPAANPSPVCRCSGWDSVVPAGKAHMARRPGTARGVGLATDIVEKGNRCQWPSKPLRSPDINCNAWASWRARCPGLQGLLSGARR